jgi:hypothetical protein
MLGFNTSRFGWFIAKWSVECMSAEVTHKRCRRILIKLLQVLLVQLTGRFLHASFDKRMIIHASSFELDMHVP